MGLGIRECMIKRSPAAYLLFFLLLAVLFAPRDAAATGQSPRKVLLLTSYHQGDRWNDSIVQGVREALGSLESVSLSIENLDMRRYTDQDHTRLTTEYIRAKYQSRPQDLVMVSDDPALNFLLTVRDDLFPTAPVVFCGVNNFSPKRIQGQSNITGVNEALSLEATLNLALKLFPKTTRILAVVSDMDASARINLELYRALAARMKDLVHFDELLNMTDKDAPDILSHLSKDSLVLRLTTLLNPEGGYLSIEEGSRIISAYAPVPIFTAWSFDLGDCALGGYVSSGQDQGRTAGNLAIRILEGQDADQIPVVMDSPNVPMFDYKVMKRFGIKESALPKGSVVLNRHVPVWEQYWGWLLGIVAIGGLQTFLILALLTRGKRLRATNFALRESERSFRDLANGGQVLIWTSGVDKLCDYFNEPWLHFTGRTLEQELGNGWAEGVHPDDYKLCLEVYVAAFDRRERFSMEYRLRHHSGEHRWILDQGSPRFDCEGAFLGYIGHCLDITEKKRAEHALEQEHNLYKDLVASQPSGVYRLRIKAQKPWVESEWVGKVESNYKLEMVSDLFCDVLGATREQCEANASIVVESIHPEDRPDFVTRNVHALQSLEAFKWEGRLKVRDKVVWVYFASVPRCLNDGDVIWTGILLDITELKQAEEQLHRHTERLRFALSAARQSWFETIVPTGEISFGQEYPKMLGYEPGEFVSNVQNWFDNIHPDDRTNVQRIFQQVLQTGGPEEVEYRRRTRSDEWKWMYTTGAVAERDAVGKPYRLTGIHMDITERKQSEDERESLHRTAEALARVFLSLGPEPRQNMDRIVRAACELTGSAAALYNRLDDASGSIEVWSGHQLPPDMPRADVPQGHICYEATIRGQDRTIILDNLENTDYENTDPSVGKYGLKAYLGHPVHLRGIAIGALAVVDGKSRSFTLGEIGAIQMLAKALSLEEERYLVEQELKQSEERFRGILQNVTTVAVQGYALDGTVRYWNHASESFYGYTAEEALGRNLLDLIIPPAMRGEVSAAIQHMADTGDLIPSSELALMRKDGSLIPVYSSHAIVRVPGQELELFCIDVDLSARQRAEAEKDKLQDQLTQAQKMESVGRLAGGVAHDFNNMLGVILGYTELALDKIGPDEPLSADLKEIQKAAKRSADLTHQLLAFARKQTVAPKVLDLNDIVENALKMLRRLIGEDIDLAWMPGNNLERIFIDSSQVDQILANLCVNARDAIAGTGKVTIKTDNVVLDGEYCARHSGFVPGEYILLAVSDNGCGMDAEMLSHIFEPFFTTKEIGKGTGLGLAMVYGAVKQNNGFINVYSEPGHGTTFKIYLPRHMATAVSRPQQKQTPAPAVGGETILLVEDEPAILMMTTQMLKKMGYTVITAGIPGEAIRLAREHKGQIDLLMTDVVMPEMNGRDLARNLLSIYPDLKRLFMSGYTANVIAHHGVLDEGVHFIQKPFSMKDLRAKLHEALKG